MYGGKADSLIKLKNSGFNVPEFFIVTSEDYRKFLKANDLEDAVKKSLKDGKREELEKKFALASIDEETIDKIRRGLDVLNCQHVSVRSSAQNEDGQKKSFAGQYDSFLNVLPSEIEKYVKACWLSFYSKNVGEYEKLADIYGMNVIIQKMIQADYAGVCFSCDPLSRTGNYSVIEVTKGLGENLVSGKITPVKYLVRRQTLRTDLKIGSNDVDDNYISELEKIVLEIEEKFGCPVDVEFAIENGEIFILQTRPITAFAKMRIDYSLAITRPISLVEVEINARGEYEGILKLTRGLYYFRPLFIYDRILENTKIYYDEFDLEEDPRQIFYYLDLDFDKIKNAYENEIKPCIARIEQLLDTDISKNETYELSEKLIEIMPFTSLGQLVGHFDDVTLRVKEFLSEFRFKYDKLVHDGVEHILKHLKTFVTQEFQDYVDYMTLKEALAGNLNIEILKKRKEGYIYFDKLYETDDCDNWLEKRGMHVVKEDFKGDVKGDVAYAGSVQGRVCLIFKEKDFDKFQKGDILVTPMTVPKFTEIIKIAGGIVTDEGGVTCHASIIAREMKIPCVVGCKNATTVLKDGDLIKLTENGEIIVLESNSSL